MSRARHMKRAAGGGVTEHEYNAVGSPAMERAKEKKKGGRVHGEGDKPKAHHGRPGRKRGGRIGANLMPLSTAARVKHITPGETPEEGEPHN